MQPMTDRLSSGSRLSSRRLVTTTMSWTNGAHATIGPVTAPQRSADMTVNTSTGPGLIPAVRLIVAASTRLSTPESMAAFVSD